MQQRVEGSHAYRVILELAFGQLESFPSAGFVVRNDIIRGGSRTTNNTNDVVVIQLTLFKFRKVWIYIAWAVRTGMERVWVQVRV